MCCHEVCRFNAIYIDRPFLGAVIYGEYESHVEGKAKQIPIFK